MQNRRRLGRGLGELSDSSLRRTTPTALKAHTSPPADIGLDGSTCRTMLDSPLCEPANTSRHQAAVSVPAFRYRRNVGPTVGLAGRMTGVASIPADVWCLC